MKKKQEKTQGITLQFLQKKYQEEKLILAKENKKLTEQLNRELEVTHKITQKYQCSQEKNAELKREVQMLRAKIMQLQRQESQYSVNQQEQLQLLKEQKTLMYTNQVLEKEKLDLENIIEKIYQEKEQIIEENKQSEEELHAAMQILQAKQEEFKRHSMQKIDQLVEHCQSLEQEKQKLADEKQEQSTKYSELKKKKKDLQKKVQQLQKLADGIKLQQDRLQQQLLQIKKENEQQHQKYTVLNTKYTLNQSKITNLQNYISKKQNEEKQLQKKLEYQIQQNQKMKGKIQKLQNQYKLLKQEYFKEIQVKQKLEVQIQKQNIEKKEIIKAMRRNQTQELIGLIKGTNSDISNKNLQRFVENQNRQGTSSQSDLQSMSRPLLHQPSEQRNLQKTKLQMMINSLQSQLSQCRKQLETMNYQLTRSKRSNEDKTLQIQRKQSELRQMRLKIDKLQNQRNKEMISLRNQNQLIKCRETEHLQRARQFQQYKTAISLKLAFYQRKIKENIDTVDRKQTIIQKLQLQKNENEDKQKIFEDHLRKLSDEVDFLRKFKTDCTRKDELMKQYRSKLQKIKSESEQYKNEVATLKKQKQRLQKQVQSKQQYIAMLKAKQEKQQKLLDKSQEQKQNKKLHDVKNGYEHKIQQIKKEREHLLLSLAQIREVIMTKVEEFVARNIPKGKKQKVPQYQAAKLLGIKQSEIQEFLNPGCSVNKKISKQLQELWNEQNYSDFIIAFTQYISNQKES